MTDRKPKGSTPVAPQRPKKAGSSSTASRNGTDTNSAQQMPSSGGGPPSSNNNSKAPSQNNSQAKNQKPAPSKEQPPTPNKGKPGTQAKKKPASGPKTAGEIAAESAPSPAPSAKPKSTSQPAPAPPPKPAPQPASDPAAARTARLRLARIDPWSVMKVSFALSIALAIVTVIAISIVWFVLGAAGVWDAVNSSVASLLSDDAETFDITEYVGYGRVIGFALLVSAVDVVLITAIATLGAFLYNLASSLLGGLELTLAEDN